MNEQYGSLDQNNKLICNYRDRCHHALLLLAVGITQPCHGDSDMCCSQKRHIYPL